MRRIAFSCAAKNNSSDLATGFPRPVNNARACDNTDADADGLIDVLDCHDGLAGFLWPPP